MKRGVGQGGYSLREKIFLKLRQDILDGKYKAGDSLVELKLAEEMGVSRTPVREAIRQLELEGLVYSIPNKGVFVEGITGQDIEDIYAIRECMEGLAARWAIERMDEQSLKELENLCELMEFYTGKGDLDRVGELNSKFHDLIFESTKSKPLKQILIDFQYYIGNIRLASLKSPGRAEQSLKEHKAIVEAFKDRDVERGERVLVEHIRNTRLNYEKMRKD
ncbi:MAG: GntR family transcriptional regulator [Clostridiales bacterium]|jgi:DNA-binding GntR family transcriptional regulator|nr:GntR family transcriptional regulator [Clostridiales bacterium]